MYKVKSSIGEQREYVLTQLNVTSYHNNSINDSKKQYFLQINRIIEDNSMSIRITYQLSVWLPLAQGIKLLNFILLILVS